MIHQVPQARRHAENPEDLLLSDVPVNLGSDNERFLTGRLRDALIRRARPVIEDPDAATPVPSCIRKILASPTVLVAESKEMAIQLRRVQPGTSPSGLLIVVDCEIDAEDAVVVAKVEHHNGMRVEQETDENGNKTFSITFLRDLIFGEGTQIYKIAAFLQSGVQDGGIRGEAGDIQNGRGVANFFLSSYLGCDFSERGDVLTQRFYDATNTVINGMSDPATRARYEIAVLAEMQRSSSTVNPSTFIRGNIEAEHQDVFESRLRELSVPMRPFEKDTTLIKTVITRMKIDTARHATILVPLDMYEDESLTITTQDDGSAHLLIKDEVKKISGAQGPSVLLPGQGPDGD